MSLIRIFFVFFQIGLLSIGGGYAVIPMIQEQVVENYAWIPQQTFADVITISQMTPGPLAVNTSTFVGLQIAGIFGALLATLGCVLAGVCIATCLYSVLRRYRNSIYISEVLNGLKAASAGLIVSAAATILLLTFTGSTEFRNLSAAAVDWPAIILFCGAFLAVRRFHLNPILAMLLTGGAGLFFYYFI